MKLKRKTFSQEDRVNVIEFLSDLVSFQNKCKNLHWSAPKKNIHEYLDQVFDKLGDYIDALAEGMMGIEGKMSPNAIFTTNLEYDNAKDFIEALRDKLIEFHDKISEGSIYSGILSETEDFIQEINKYVYLFSLSAEDEEFGV